MNPTFSVEVIISNKPQARDPEGETIIRGLIHKTGFESVSDVRSGKFLMIRIEAKDETDAQEKVVAMCNDLRLYNPVAHLLRVRLQH